jgi:hypothetical protein
VPRALGQAFHAFWQHKPGSYPAATRVERLM